MPADAGVRVFLPGGGRLRLGSGPETARTLTGWAHPIHPWSNAELDAHYRADEREQDHTDLCAQQSRRTDAAPSAVPPVRPGPVPLSSSGAGPESDDPPETALLDAAMEALCSDWCWTDLKPHLVRLISALRWPE